MERVDRWFSLSPKASNLVDQVAVVTDLQKSEFVSDAIIIAALVVKILGEEALRAAAESPTTEILSKVSI